MTTIVNYTDVPSVPYNGDAVRNAAGRLLIGAADGADNFFMRMFELSEGGFTPRHAHDWEHQVFVLDGKGTVLKDDAWADIRTGDVVFVPANAEHQFRNAGPEVLRFLCLIPNKGQPEL